MIKPPKSKNSKKTIAISGISIFVMMLIIGVMILANPKRINKKFANNSDSSETKSSETAINNPSKGETANSKSDDSNKSTTSDRAATSSESITDIQSRNSTASNSAKSAALSQSQQQSPSSTTNSAHAATTASSTLTNTTPQKPTTSNPEQNFGQGSIKPAESESTGTKQPSTNTNTSTPTAITVIKTYTKDDTKSYTKYGVKAVETSTNTYNVYSNGTEKIVKSVLKVAMYNHATFNASAKDMWDEAIELNTTNVNIAQQILAEANKYRTETGVAPLILDTKLSTVANIRAIEMAWSDKFSHTRPNGEECYSLGKELNIPFSGENLARGPLMKTGADAIKAWRNSEGHYKNMVKKEFTKLGVGAYWLKGKYYYVQIFDY